MIDTMVTITRLIVTGIFDEIPNLKVVLGHLGEALPFLLARMDHRIHFLPNPNVKNKHNITHYFKNNIWVTTSGNMSNEAFVCTVNTIGLDRIMFSGDHPFVKGEEMLEFVKNLPLDESDRRKLYYENAQILGINAPWLPGVMN